jgi:mannose-6-phosphate isomerase-like protein (cupin superfamily)
MLGSGSPDALGTGLVVIGRTVREIHPDDIDAGLHHALENVGRR